MKTRLENQIAIVTGSSSGNGRAIALALSSSGATVVCADLNKKARKEGYEKDIEIDTDDVIQRRGSKAVYVQADVRHAPEVENLVTRTVSDFGRRGRFATSEVRLIRRHRERYSAWIPALLYPIIYHGREWLYVASRERGRLLAEPRRGRRWLLAAIAEMACVFATLLATQTSRGRR